jgi:urease gamma subunit
MAEPPNPSPDKLLRQAGSLIASRKEAGDARLDDAQRTAVQDATTAVVQELRQGRTVAEIEQGLIQAGWPAQVAGGFILLVSRLLAKMYAVRTCLFGGLTLLALMLASVIVPLATEGEFSWLLAGLMVFIGLVCLLATVRNLQLCRRFRMVKPA